MLLLEGNVFSVVHHLPSDVCRLIDDKTLPFLARTHFSSCQL